MKRKESFIAILILFALFASSCKNKTGRPDDHHISESDHSGGRASDGSNSGPPPLAYFFTAAHDTGYYPGEDIRFINCSANADHFSWDFGDATFSHEKEPLHVYRDTGIYTVTLKAASGERSHLFSMDIRIDYFIQDKIQSLVDVFQGEKRFPGVCVAVHDPTEDKMYTSIAGYSHDDIRISEQMLFGGPTSPMTAAICLRMLDEGIIGLHDAVGKYLGNLQNVDPGITIEQLLFHQSGLFEFLRSRPLDAKLNATIGNFWSTEETLSWLEEPYDAPGEKTYFSFTNIFLLGVVMEKASGKSFHELINHYIKNELDLKHTYNALYDSYDVKRTANPYAANNWRSYGSAAMYSYLYPVASTVSTAAEHAYTIHSIFNTAYLSERSKRILNTRIRFTQEPGATHRVNINLASQYSVSPGFVWNRTLQMYVMGRLLMSGYTGFSAYIPENKISVAIMVNGLASFPAQEQLARDIADLFN